MEGDKRGARQWAWLRDMPRSVLSGWPYPLKRCDAPGCEENATEHCSSHGAHFCHRHFVEHREEWHRSTWETPMAVVRC